MFRRLFFILITSIFFLKVSAQNTLPDFSVDDLGKGHIRISWVNQYGASCIQMNVQRSYDSVKNFRSILAVQSPELPQNGFIDANETGTFMYYRIFYVLNGGAYYFTKSKHAASGFANAAIENNNDPNQIITVMLHDSVYAQFHFTDFKKFQDSVLHQTRDSLFAVTPTQVLLKPYIPQGDWIPSVYIFTNRDGNVAINVTDAKKENYMIKFFDSDDKDIFTIKHLDYTQLVLDKANFIHSGWFTFELYENNKLKERNKFFLQKDF